MRSMVLPLLVTGGKEIFSAFKKFKVEDQFEFFTPYFHQIEGIEFYNSHRRTFLFTLHYFFNPFIPKASLFFLGRILWGFNALEEATLVSHVNRNTLCNYRSSL